MFLISQTWTIKSLQKAVEEGVSAEEISTRYIKECKKDMADMNVKPNHTPSGYSGN